MGLEEQEQQPEALAEGLLERSRRSLRLRYPINTYIIVTSVDFRTDSL